MKSSYIETVKNTVLFRSAQPETVEAAASGRVMEFEKGDVIYGRREFRSALCILLEGSARASKGSGVVMNTFEPGAMFGLASMFSGTEEYVSDIVAVTACTVLFIEQQVLESLMERDYLLVKNYIVYLTDRIRFLNSRIEEFTRPTAEKKLAAYLAARFSGEGSLLTGSFSTLAGKLGIGRASLYRAMDSLAQRGFIVWKNKKVEVLYGEGLARFGGGAK